MEEKIYKDYSYGMKLLSKIDRFYYLEENFFGENLKTVRTRVLGDVDYYFQLLKKYEGYKVYDYVNMQRKSLFKRNK